MTLAPNRLAQMLDQMADHVLAHGLPAAGLRPLAKAAGTSDRMLLYYFEDKAALMTAILQHLAARLTGLLAAHRSVVTLPFDQLQPRLAEAILSDQVWPFLRLWLEIVGLAARGDAAFAKIGQQIGHDFLAWGAAQLDSATSEAQKTDAAKLLVMMEGLVVLKAIGFEQIGRDSL